MGRAAALAYAREADLSCLQVQAKVALETGDSVIVVEHDMRVTAASDWIVAIGSGAGNDGGRIVATRHRSR